MRKCQGASMELSKPQESLYCKDVEVAQGGSQGIISQTSQTQHYDPINGFITVLH